MNLITLFCICGTIFFLMGGAIWSKDSALNFFIKASLFLMALVGVFATIEQLGFHR